MGRSPSPQEYLGRGIKRIVLRERRVPTLAPRPCSVPRKNLTPLHVVLPYSPRTDRFCGGGIHAFHSPSTRLTNPLHRSDRSRLPSASTFFRSTLVDSAAASIFLAAASV